MTGVGSVKMRWGRFSPTSWRCPMVTRCEAFWGIPRSVRRGWRGALRAFGARGRVAEIREDATADGDVAMARRAEPLKEGFTVFYRGDAGGGLWWLELRRSELRKRGKASFAV